MPVKPGSGHLALIFRRKKDGQIFDLYANLLFPLLTLSLSSQPLVFLLHPAKIVMISHGFLPVFPVVCGLLPVRFGGRDDPRIWLACSVYLLAGKGQALSSAISE